METIDKDLNSSGYVTVIVLGWKSNLKIKVNKV